MDAKTELKQNEMAAGANYWDPLKDGGKHKTSDEIEQDIEFTRREMDNTLNALGEKFNLRHYVDDFINSFQPGAEETKENLTDLGRRISDALMRDPLPATLIGSGLGLLIYENTGGKRVELISEERRREIAERRMEARGQMRERAEAAQEKLQGKTEEAKERMAAAQEKFQKRAEETADEFQKRVAETQKAASEKVSEARETIAGNFKQMSEQGSSFTTSADENIRKFVHDNPLALGIAAFAFGMLAGSFFPAAPQEKKLMGEKAGEIGQKSTEKASEVTETAMEKGKEAAVSATEAATEKVKEQNKASEKKEVPDIKRRSIDIK